MHKTISFVDIYLLTAVTELNKYRMVFVAASEYGNLTVEPVDGTPVGTGVLF